MASLCDMAYPKNDQTCPTVYVMKTQQDYWQEDHNQVMEEMKFRDPEPDTISCMAGGAEMLRVTPDGFWVRGAKVEQDDNEAQAVYNAFKSWMSWAQLNRDYK